MIAPELRRKITVEFCIWLQSNFDAVIEDLKDVKPIPAPAAKPAAVGSVWQVNM